MNSNQRQIYVFVRNAIIGFLIFVALESMLGFINWKRVNWEVVIPTVLSLVVSLGIWVADRVRAARERKQLAVIEQQLERDRQIKERQDDNLRLIQELQDSLDTVIVTQSSLANQLRELEQTDTRTLDRLHELGRDLETHRDRWAHEKAEASIRELQDKTLKLGIAFEQAVQASELVTKALNSGAFVGLSQWITGLSIEVAALRTQLEKKGLIEERDRSR